MRSSNNEMSKKVMEAWYSQLLATDPRKKSSFRTKSNEQWLKDLVKENHENLNGLWLAYNDSRDQAKQKRVSEGQFALAYVLGFHLNNFQRHQQILARSSVFDKMNLTEEPTLKNKIRLLDLGCGSGAWSMAVLEHIKIKEEIQLEVDLIDRSRYLLSAAETGVKCLREDARVRKMQSLLGDGQCLAVLNKICKEVQSQNQILFIGLSYVWNELRLQAKSRVRLLHWFKSLATSSAPILLFLSDPGREREARSLQKLREELVHSGFGMLYPCPQTHSCPMLKTQRDWCYSEVTNQRIKIWEPVSQALKLKRENLAVSSYILVNAAANSCFEKSRLDWVVVGRPKIEGKEYCLCCNGKTLRKIRSLKGGLRGENCQGSI